MTRGEEIKHHDKTGLGDVLYEPEGGKAEADIVFVHGLGGTRTGTWTWKNQDDKIFWPQDLLPVDCPTARILSFGYNADFAKFFPDDTKHIAPELTIDDYSTSLLEALKVVRGDADSERPIIFVAHSMGGLVVANAVSRSHGTDIAKQGIADHTIGMLFLGTPFEGSSTAKYASIALGIMKHILKTQPSNLEDLQKRSHKLASINDLFAKFLKARDRAEDKPRLELSCYFEAWRMGKGLGFIVPKESATWLGVDPLSIQANHVDMCKFQTEQATGYISVAGTLKEWIANIERNKRNGKQGGVGGVNAQSIGVIMGNVDNRGVKNDGGIVMGNAYGTKEHANKFIGSIKYVGIPPGDPTNF